MARLPGGKTCLMCTQHLSSAAPGTRLTQENLPFGSVTCPKWDGKEIFWVIWYWKSLFLHSLDTTFLDSKLLDRQSRREWCYPNLQWFLLLLHIFKCHFIPISDPWQWAPWVIPKLRSLNMILNHRILSRNGQQDKCHPLGLSDLTWSHPKTSPWEGTESCRSFSFCAPLVLSCWLFCLHKGTGRVNSLRNMSRHWRIWTLQSRAPAVLLHKTASN